MAISLKHNKHTAGRTASRLRRQMRGRKKLAGTAERPRLVGALHLLELGLDPRHRGEGVAVHVVDELRLDASVGAEHRQPRPLGGTGHLGPYPAPPAQTGVRLGGGAHARLPTFRVTRSPS